MPDFLLTESTRLRTQIGLVHLSSQFIVQPTWSASTSIFAVSNPAYIYRSLNLLSFKIYMIVLGTEAQTMVQIVNLLKYSYICLHLICYPCFDLLTK